MLTDKIFKYLKDCYVCKFKLTPEDSSIECRSLNCNVYICAKCSVKPTEMVFRYSDGVNEFYSKKHQINHNKIKFQKFVFIALAIIKKLNYSTKYMYICFILLKINKIPKKKSVFSVSVRYR